MSDGQYIHNEEADAGQHGGQKDSEARGDSNKLDVAKVIARLDVVEETASCEDPPRIPTQSLVGSRLLEQIALSAEVEKVGRDF